MLLPGKQREAIWLTMELKEGPRLSMDQGCEGDVSLDGGRNRFQGLAASYRHQGVVAIGGHKGVLVDMKEFRQTSATETIVHSADSPR
jgi:hypothetical protein